VAPVVRHRTTWLLALCLIALVLGVYSQTATHEFVDFDDPLYITTNPQVQAGLTADSIHWAWTTGHAANWHPVTWMSHQLDVTLFGMDPGPHHLMNVAWHLAATLLLFGLLVDLTGARWPSVWVAALFAIHPAHVESVAWMAERKDVLSTTFWFATTWAWVRYVRAPKAMTYVGVCVLFALGLASKPMLVTLPLTLLLLDVWPLGRASRSLRARIIEKLPLFALAAISSVITVVVQRQGGAVSGLDQLPLTERLGNAALAYVGYLWHLIAPLNLSVFYPYSNSVSPPAVAGAVVVMIGISLVVWRYRAHAPYALTGWAWFVVTLVPVIGLVQVGTQAMADRYTYVPYVGLCIALAWGARAWSGGSRATMQTRIVQALGIVTVFAAAWLAHAQVATWRTSETLWAHAVVATPDSAKAHNSLGAIYGNQGRLADAAQHFQEALRLRPDGQEAQHIVPNLAQSLLDQGRAAESIPYFQQAIRMAPTRAELHHGLGLALLAVNRTDEAITAWRETVRLSPNAERTWSLLGMTLASEQRATEARAAFAEVLRINPTNADARRAMVLLGGR
jgi:Flp pilus assembly protein TadD